MYKYYNKQPVYRSVLKFIIWIQSQPLEYDPCLLSFEQLLKEVLAQIMPLYLP